jgi:hypothetical protein
MGGPASFAGDLALALRIHGGKASVGAALPAALMALALILGALLGLIALIARCHDRTLLKKKMGEKLMTGALPPMHRLSVHGASSLVRKKCRAA